MASNHGQLRRDLIGRSLTIGNKVVVDQNLNANLKKLKASQLEFSGVISYDNCPCVLLKYICDEDVPIGRILKVSDSTDFHLKEMKAADDSIIGVVGISATSAETGGVVEVCTSGVFDVEVETGASIIRGDRLMKSSSEDGKVVGTSTSVGVFGIALQSTSATDVQWNVLGGSSDFNTESVSFPPTEVVCHASFTSTGTAYAHSHDEPTNIKIDLWNGRWVNVFSQILDTGAELEFNSLNITFPKLIGVTKIRFFSSPGQNQSFHSFQDFEIHLTCNYIKGCYIKSENY